ncbi:MAG: hypothetical protein J6P53_01715, partial [Mailhella sp.]|nr:hypothetical protein [Mailhella sp.]
HLLAYAQAHFNTAFCFHRKKHGMTYPSFSDRISPGRIDTTSSCNGDNHHEQCAIDFLSVSKIMLHQQR